MLLCSPERPPYLFFPPLFLTPASHCFQERTRKMHDYDINLQVSSHVEATVSLQREI